MTGQDVYHDKRFFTLYQAIREARAGVNEAIEQPALRAMLPPVNGAAVVDLGCGDGQLSRDLVSWGAASVIGVDPSERMLALAGQRTTDDRVRYVRAFAEDAVLAAASVDLVIKAGLVVRRVVEPTPTAQALSERPDLERHRRRPALLVLSATKP